MKKELENNYSINMVSEVINSSDYIYLTGKDNNGNYKYFELLDSNGNKIPFKELDNLPTMELLDYFGGKLGYMVLFCLDFCENSKI